MDIDELHRFPLWHGKVATQDRALPTYRVGGQFPLWHGKVATNASGGETFVRREFPLWHGKVATRRAWASACKLHACFRFGMVKLQLDERMLCDSSNNSFRFGMVKLQRNTPAKHRDNLPRFRFGMVKLQRLGGDTWISGQSEFPLWHGKVATWVSSQVPQCLSVKDLLSTASTAKKAVG